MAANISTNMAATEQEKVETDHSAYLQQEMAACILCYKIALRLRYYVSNKVESI